MSKIVVDIENDDKSELHTVPFGNTDKGEQKGRSLVFKIFAVFSVFSLLAALVLAIGGIFYWQYLKTTPQYSLAMLVDSARRSDEKAIDKLIDTGAIVDDFVPQVVEKAVELYGRGLAPSIIKRLSRIAAPFLPVVKQRARAELPNFLREKTKRFEKVPFWVMVVGAERYLEFKEVGDEVIVTSKLKDRPLNLTMRKNGEMWQIVGLKDDILAQRVAEKIGQEMIGLAKNKSKKRIDDLGKQIGVPNLGDIINRTEEIFR